MIKAFREQYAPKGADGQVLRVADRFGLVAAAGELACGFGVVPWQPGEALEAVRQCFADWFDSRGGTEAGEVQAGISQVRLFIENHGDFRFESLARKIAPSTIAPDGARATALNANGLFRPRLGSAK